MITVSALRQWLAFPVNRPLLLLRRRESARATLHVWRRRRRSSVYGTEKQSRMARYQQTIISKTAQETASRAHLGLGWQTAGTAAAAASTASVVAAEEALDLPASTQTFSGNEQPHAAYAEKRALSSKNTGRPCMKGSQQLMKGSQNVTSTPR